MKRYTFNKNIFDIIDTEEKAYWLGFIWCDGYVLRRERNPANVEYAFKLDLNSDDKEHVMKLRNFLQSNHPVKIYRTKGYKEDGVEVARLHISNRHFGQKLYHGYGVVAGRSDFNSFKNLIPESLFKHFIRGVLDADGSLVVSNVELYKHSSTKTYTKQVNKLAVNFSTHTEIIEAIQKHLFEHGVIASINKTSKRHELSDGDCVCLKYGGNKQCKKIVSYLYRDANIYLERKYHKYLDFLKV